MIRPVLAAAWLAAALAAGACARAGPAPAEAPSVAAAAPALPSVRAVDFQSQVRPLLEARCSPCHFAGGTMHAKLPFDQPATIHHLGERLFTRIEAPDDQALLRAFLQQPHSK